MNIPRYRMVGKFMFNPPVGADAVMQAEIYETLVEMEKCRLMLWPDQPMEYDIMFDETLDLWASHHSNLIRLCR